MRGQSLLELLLTMSVLITVSALAVPSVARAVEEGRLRGAAFHLSSRLLLLRAQAVRRYANVALRFTASGGTYLYQTFGDGDGDGVHASDIAVGRDPALDAPDDIGRHFHGVTFGFVVGCPLIDGSSVPVGASPIRIGSSGLLTFAPSGTATSGTLYLRGSSDAAYAIVILGATGRTRLLRCTPRQGTWSVDGR
jgi:hypothetical protein